VRLAVGAFADAAATSPGKSFTPGDYKIRISQSVDVQKMNRAIAKTAFNLGIKLLGNDVMKNPALNPIREYCWNGVGDDPKHPFVGYLSEQKQIATCPDKIASADVGTHALMLLSNGDRLIGLIRLYGATIYRVHLGSPAFKRFERTAFVDYAARGIYEA